MSNEHKKPPKHLGNVETDIGKLLLNNYIATLLLITQDCCCHFADNPHFAQNNDYTECLSQVKLRSNKASCYDPILKKSIMAHLTFK